MMFGSISSMLFGFISGDPPKVDACDIVNYHLWFDIPILQCTFVCACREQAKERQQHHSRRDLCPELAACLALFQQLLHLHRNLMHHRTMLLVRRHTNITLTKEQ